MPATLTVIGANCVRGRAVGLIPPWKRTKRRQFKEASQARPRVTTLQSWISAPRLQGPETDRARLAEPELYFDDHVDDLVILDEVQRMPGLFETLREVIDRGRREGRGTGTFLLLGSAGIDLLSQSGETLAGRVAFQELTPFDITEVGGEDLDPLWLRGGFPESFLAADEAVSLRWRQDFIRTYLERDVPQLRPRIPAETLRRLWTMLAHQQGGLLNAAQLARNLGVSGKTVSHYLDLMVDLLLVRRLQPYLANAGKRLVRSPKVYVRDSGLLHALLGIAGKEALLGHPVVGGRNVGDRGQTQRSAKARTRLPLESGRPETHSQLRRLRGPRALLGGAEDRGDRPR